MARGGYTFEEIAKMTVEEISFLYHYQELDESEKFTKYAKALGIIWDLDEINASSKNNKDDDNSNRIIYVPLSTVIDPKITDSIKERSKSRGKYIGGGSYVPKGSEKIRSMGDLTKEDFYSLIGKNIPSKGNK